MNSRQTILLVDDNEYDVLLMLTAFKKAEFNAPMHVARNGEDAIAYLSGTGPYSDRTKFPLPTLILLDINMPKKNGFDVLQWIRENRQISRVSITMLTASLRPEDVDRAIDLGANAYLVKPSDLESLALMMRSLRDWMRINQYASTLGTSEENVEPPHASPIPFTVPGLGERIDPARGRPALGEAG